MCKALEDMRNEAREEGYNLGKNEGKEEKLLENVRTLMSALNFSPQQVFDILMIPADDREKILSRLSDFPDPQPGPPHTPPEGSPQRS